MLWLAGCFYISDEELVEEIQARTAVQGPVQVTSVEPAWGLTSGGAVEIHGRGFTDQVEVHFGGVPATVTQVSQDHLYVEAPEVDEAGLVDVTVSRGSAEGRLAEAYRYWADGTDQIGVVGSLWYVQKRGDYWAASETDTASLQFRVIEPVPEFDYSKWWAAAPDTCEANPVSPYTVVPYDLPALGGPDTATVTSNGVAIDVPWDSTYLGYALDEFPVAKLLTTQVWSLQPLALPGGPTIETTRLVVSPGSWEVVTPRIDGVAEAQAPIADLDVTWSAAGGSTVLLQLGLMKVDQSGFESELFCVLTDDGQFTVPASFTTTWPAGREVHMLIGRYVEPRGSLAFNGAEAAALFVDWRYGAFVAK